MTDRPPVPPQADLLHAPAPEGRSSFDLPLGSLRVRVLDLPAGWSFVTENYAPFCEPAGAATPDFVVTCRQGAGVVVPLPSPGGVTVLHIDPAPGERYVIRSHWQDGFVDVGAGRGEVVLTNRAYIPLRMSLENYLRAATQLLLLSRGAFLIHGGGVLDGERCFVLFGPSGAGKSTATELSAPRQALSDDMVLLDVRDERPLAHAVPFFGAFPPAERVRGVWPVAAALRLRQAPEDRITRLSPAQAVATLSASVPFVHELGVRHEGLTALVTTFCRTAPVCDLHFTKSRRFWDLVTREFPQPLA